MFKNVKDNWEGITTLLSENDDFVKYFAGRTILGAVIGSVVPVTYMLLAWRFETKE